MAWVNLGSVADYPEDHGVAVRVGTRRLAVFRIGAQIFVLDDSCPHRRFPLYDGVVNGSSVRCRTHGSCFNLATGAVEHGPAQQPVRVYRGAIVDAHVEVEVPD